MQRAAGHNSRVHELTQQAAIGFLAEKGDFANFLAQVNYFLQNPNYLEDTTEPVLADGSKENPSPTKSIVNTPPVKTAGSPVYKDEEIHEAIIMAKLFFCLQNHAQVTTIHEKVDATIRFKEILKIAHAYLSPNQYPSTPSKMQRVQHHTLFNLKQPEKVWLNNRLTFTTLIDIAMDVLVAKENLITSLLNKLSRLASEQKPYLFSNKMLTEATSEKKILIKNFITRVQNTYYLAGLIYIVRTLLAENSTVMQKRSLFFTATLNAKSKLYISLNNQLVQLDKTSLSHQEIIGKINLATQPTGELTLADYNKIVSQSLITGKNENESNEPLSQTTDAGKEETPVPQHQNGKKSVRFDEENLKSNSDMMDDFTKKNHRKI